MRAIIALLILGLLMNAASFSGQAIPNVVECRNGGGAQSCVEPYADFVQCALGMYGCIGPTSAPDASVSTSVIAKCAGTSQTTDKGTVTTGGGVSFGPVSFGVSYSTPVGKKTAYSISCEVAYKATGDAWGGVLREAYLISSIKTGIDEVGGHCNYTGAPDSTGCLAPMTYVFLEDSYKESGIVKKNGMIPTSVDICPPDRNNNVRVENRDYLGLMAGTSANSDWDCKPAPVDYSGDASGLVISQLGTIGVWGMFEGIDVPDE